MSTLYDFIKMDESTNNFDFDTIFDDKLPIPNPGLKKRYQTRQLSTRTGNESDSSLESIDLNNSSDVSKVEIQKPESPRNFEENANFNNNSKGLYNCRTMFGKGRSLDQTGCSSDDNSFVIPRYSLSSKPKRFSKRQKPLLTLERFDKPTLLSVPSSLTLSPPTDTLSSTSSTTTSPSSTTSNQTFKLSPRSSHRNSVFDDLLFEIYNRWHFTSKESFDSDTFTDVTENDGVVGGRDKSSASIKLNRKSLANRSTEQLQELVSQLTSCSNKLSSRLIKHLRSREKQMAGLREKFDIMTAFLQASSHKTREDSKIRFSIEPMPGEDAFQQWKGAMRAVVRLPGGVPAHFRKKVWLALADNYLGRLCIDWSKTRRFAFNERSNPDDSKLGLQIVKDLHRTGCSRFSGRDNEQDRAVLKRVLLAYARWNKRVGYCQGFNILAALILGVVDWQEDAALKVMIYVIDKVLPENYFANNLRSLSVDMAVFRDLLRSQLPKLSKHLDELQTQGSDPFSGSNYEPPLTNVFTMQWLLTMYATCLSPATTLRLWDCILLEGSEILLRTGVVIWMKLQTRILAVTNASEFYCLMGLLSQQILSCDVISAEELVQLAELREKFTYNITPFRASVRGSNERFVPRKSLLSTSLATSSGVEEEEGEEEDMMDGVHCFSGIFSMQNNMANKMKEDSDRVDISQLSPGAYTAHPDTSHPPSSGAPVLSERASLDLEMLRRQYKRVMQRQRKAHLILSVVHDTKTSNDQLSSQNVVFKALHQHSTHSSALHLSPPAINHLLASRDLLASSKKNQTVLPITNFLQARFGFKRTLALKHIDKQLQKIEQQSAAREPGKPAGQSATKDASTNNLPNNQSTIHASSTNFLPSDAASTHSCSTSQTESLRPPSSSSSSSSTSISFQNPHDDHDNDTDTTFEPSHPWHEAVQHKQQEDAFDHVKFLRERGVFVQAEGREEFQGGADEPNDWDTPCEQSNELASPQADATAEAGIDATAGKGGGLLEDLLEEKMQKERQIESFIQQASIHHHSTTFITDDGGSDDDVGVEKKHEEKDEKKDDEDGEDEGGRGKKDDEDGEDEGGRGKEDDEDGEDEGGRGKKDDEDGEDEGGRGKKDDGEEVCVVVEDMGKTLAGASVCVGDGVERKDSLLHEEKVYDDNKNAGGTSISISLNNNNSNNNNNVDNNNRRHHQEIGTSSDTCIDGTASEEGDSPQTDASNIPPKTAARSNTNSSNTIASASVRTPTLKGFNNIKPSSLANLMGRGMSGVSHDRERPSIGCARVVNNRVSETSLAAVRGVKRASVAFNPFPRSMCSARRASQVGLQLGMYRLEEASVASAGAGAGAGDRRCSLGGVGGGRLKKSANAAYFRGSNTASFNEGSAKVKVNNSNNSVRMGGLDSSIKVGGDEGQRKVYNACLQRQYMATVVNHNYKASKR